MDTATLTAAIHELGLTAFNLGYQDFLDALNMHDDYYARGKYDDLRKLGRAMCALSDNTLARLIEKYRRVGA